MARLYPPIIESTVHACYMENGMVKLTIPFSMNTAVSQVHVGGFALKIKTVQTGTVLYTIKAVNPAHFIINDTESYVVFYLNDDKNKMKVGQFYKIQLAYIQIDKTKRDKYYSDYVNGIINEEQYETELNAISTVGYYSSIGTIKYTTKPLITINNFSENAINTCSNKYTGYYDQTGGDNTERVYSYQFNIYDLQNNIILSSGECLHNTLNDTNENWSIDEYYVSKDLQYDVIYKIQYIVTTINKMIISSPKYRIIQRETIDPEIQADLIVDQNFDNGYITVSLVPHKDFYIQRAIDICSQEGSSWLSKIEDIKEKGFNTFQAEIIYHNKNNLSNVFNLQYSENCTGAFLLSKACEDSDFSDWEPLTKIKFYNEIPEKIIYKDFTCIQGKKYIYSLQQYNDDGLYSKRLLSKIIISDFEDAFLYDGVKQLKIKYNFKMNKFTNTVLESKQDTIGDKYPHFFRNGNVNYHEFPISGLISYFMDEENLFVSQEDLITDEKTINYTTENVAQERLFKLKVLEWLNNGKPKLFRSPTEGNYIIRLIKISLTPEQKLGRLLHNFSSTAYEVMEFNNYNLQNLNIINVKEQPLSLMKFFTVDLSNYGPNNILNVYNGITTIVNSVDCKDMFFGDELLITYENNQQETVRLSITGEYFIDKTIPIKAISVLPRYKKTMMANESNYQEYYVKNSQGKYEIANTYSNYIDYYEISNPQLKGQMTFSFSTIYQNNFSLIRNVNYEIPAFQQFIGKHTDILQDLISIDKQPDLKKELIHLYYIKATKRPIDRIIQQHGTNNNIYYYGLDQYSEKLKFTEIRYPIGLRPYYPNRYYIKVNGKYVLADGDYQYTTQDAEGNIEYVTYYLRGRYVRTAWPVGNIVYEPNVYYIFDGEQYWLSEGDFQEGVDYYRRYYDTYGIARYAKQEHLTISDDYIFKPGKFYRKTDSGVHYTLSNSFVDNRDYYYELLDYTYPEITQAVREGREDSLYVNAYVTIDNKYVYSSRNYYAKVFTKDIITGEPIERYERCNSGDFNVHGFAAPEEVEYGPFNNEVIQYYKVKPILPHILHIIGTSWNLDTDINNTGIRQVTDNTVVEQYQFKPLLTTIGDKQYYTYIDFYNDERIYNNYEPWIKINDEIIQVKDTLYYSIEDIKNLNITHLESGNGVVLEVGYQLRNLEYNIEKSSEQKTLYLDSMTVLDEKLTALLDPTHPSYIDLSKEPDNTKLSIYNSFMNNNWQRSVVTRYKSLLNDISEKLRGS